VSKKHPINLSLWIEQKSRGWWICNFALSFWAGTLVFFAFFLGIWTLILELTQLTHLVLRLELKLYHGHSCVSNLQTADHVTSWPHNHMSKSLIIDLFLYICITIWCTHILLVLFLWKSWSYIIYNLYICKMKVIFY
jgi:hypothetical protein